MISGLLTLGGCASTSGGVTGPCPTPPVISEPETDVADTDWFAETAVVVEEYGQGLVGFSESAAEACATEAGLSWRVVARDGEYFAVTSDYVPLRLNVVVDNQIVTETSSG